MRAIETRYLGPTNHRGARIVASDGDGNRLVMSYDCAHDREKNHTEAALALCRKMRWMGELVRGSTRRGYVHVIDGFVAGKIK